MGRGSPKNFMQENFGLIFRFFDAYGLRLPDGQTLLLLASVVPKRGRSKHGRTQKHANTHKRGQMSARERKSKSAKERQRAQKSASAKRL